MGKKKRFTDDLGRRVEVSFPPQRIISLVPSITELLYDLGLNERVVGITKFCVRPPIWHKTKTKIGGTKTPDIEKITALKPDLIIASKEENTKPQIDALAKKFPVWVSDVKTIMDAMQLITDTGRLTDKENEASILLGKLIDEGVKLERKIKSWRSAAYLIWHNPLMSIGGDTFINEMVYMAGFENIFKKRKRYPKITMEELKKRTPEYLLLPDEPFPFNTKHQKEFQQLLPHTKVLLVDGQMFSWYGSRIIKAPAYFRQLHNKLKS